MVWNGGFRNWLLNWLFYRIRRCICCLLWWAITGLTIIFAVDATKEEVALLTRDQDVDIIVQEAGVDPTEVAHQTMASLVVEEDIEVDNAEASTKAVAEILVTSLAAWLSRSVMRRRVKAAARRFTQCISATCLTVWIEINLRKRSRSLERYCMQVSHSMTEGCQEDSESLISPQRKLRTMQRRRWTRLHSTREKSPWELSTTDLT